MGKVKPNGELTSAQHDVLRLYRKHVDKYGSEPTVRWIANELGVFPNTVQWHLTKLRERGYLNGKVTQIRLTISAKARRSGI
mgnify:FL=1